MVGRGGSRSIDCLRRTRIIATLGPASSTERSIRELLKAGVDVFRLNFSHGDAAWHRTTAGRVRDASRALGEPATLLGDLSGPKMRTGRFAAGAIELRDGEPVVVTTRKVEGRAGLVPSQYRALPRDLRRGEPLLLDDGKIELRVERTGETDVACRVVRGGTLSDHKGINLPGSTVSAPPLTAKDRRDATTAVELGLDYVALSFVRRASDVQALRSYLLRLGSDIPIVAKIEKPQAVAAIDSILAVSDAIMVARGDLGVELPPEQVPVVQRELIRRAMAADRPVIVATQMLESMISSPRPTRAETNDVASAVYSSADAVMLSAETATGAYPIEAVRVMDRIVRAVEGDLASERRRRGGSATLPEEMAAREVAAGRRATDERPPGAVINEAVGRAAARLSGELQVRCIVVPTRTGVSARMVSADRPDVPILAVSEDAALCRRMHLLWGVVPIQARLPEGEAMDRAAVRVARARGFVAAGQHVLVLRGFHSNPRLQRPTITVLRAS